MSGKVIESESYSYNGMKGTIRRRYQRWSIRYRVHGREVHYTTKTCDKAEAVLILRNALKAAYEEEQKGMLRDVLKVDSLTTENTASNIGAIAEMMVAIDLINRGLPTYRACTPNAPADLIAIFDGTPKLVEVKVGFINGKGNVKIGAMRPTCRYDFLALVDRHLGIIYLPELPVKQVLVDEGGINGPALDENTTEKKGDIG